MGGELRLEKNYVVVTKVGGVSRIDARDLLMIG